MSSPKNRTTTSKGSVYKWRDQTYPSVTTIIGGGVPKPALINWAAKSAATFAVNNRAEWEAIAEKDSEAAIDLVKGAPRRDRDHAAGIGSTLHDYAENDSLGLESPKPDLLVANHVTQVRKFVQEFEPKYELSEASVYNREHNYAGTLDAIAVIGGKKYLIDYKTSRSGIWPETALQLAAYRHAEFVGMPSGEEVPMPEVDGALAIHVTAKDYSVIPVDTEQYVFRTFLYAKEIYEWCKNIGKGALGAPMSVPLKVVA